MALNLAYHTLGAGPPLLVLHGLFGSGGNWRGVARSLAASFTVHCVDLRNHGASPWADSMGYAEMAEDVRLLMDRLGIDSVDVMAAASRAEVQGRLRQRVPDPGVVPFLMQNLVTQNAHFDWRLNLIGITAAMPGLCGFPAELLGARFDGPTTVIAGENSHYVAERAGAAFRPMFAQLDVQVVAGAGHWVHADQPAAFVACVQRALQADAARPATTP